MAKIILKSNNNFFPYDYTRRLIWFQFHLSFTSLLCKASEKVVFSYCHVIQISHIFCKVIFFLFLSFGSSVKLDNKKPWILATMYFEFHIFLCRLNIKALGWDKYSIGFWGILYDISHIISILLLQYCWNLLIYILPIQYVWSVLVFNAINHQWHTDSYILNLDKFDRRSNFSSF